MRSTIDQSTIRWLLVVGLYCFRGLKIDFNQNLSLCDRCTKSVRVYHYSSSDTYLILLIVIVTVMVITPSQCCSLAGCCSRHTPHLSQHPSISCMCRQQLSRATTPAPGCVAKHVKAPSGQWINTNI